MIKTEERRAATAVLKIPKGVQEVLIPTVTAIVCDARDPYRVLVGKSSKHKYPVLPGGKIDQADKHGVSFEEAGKRAIVRELSEEVKLTNPSLRLLAAHNFEKVDLRDIPDKRVITAESLRGSLAWEALDEATKLNSRDTQVLGYYGVPEYIFIAPVNVSEVSRSEELEKILWVDARQVISGEIKLSAGHERIVKRYVESLK